jgi:hypothetical protein
MLLLLSLLAWSYIFWNAHKHPISNVPFRLRGGGGGETTTTSHTHYYYKIRFPHNSIDPSQPIIFYDAFATSSYFLPPYYQFMDYGNGVLSVPGTQQNSLIESVATATYYVYYSSDDLVIDYDNAEFKINKRLIKNLIQTKVKGTFEYISVMTPFKDVASVIDGKWDTQVQTTFYGEPPTGYNYAILDLGSIKNIQALDIIAGFFKPDDIRKFDIDFNFSLKYSTDGVTYYDISDKTNNVNLTGGQKASFEESDLGIGFQTRYLKLVLEGVKKINYGSITVTVSDSNRQKLIDANIINSSTTNGSTALLREGTWVIAITELAAYDNIVIKSEAKLIPTTTLTQAITLGVLTSGQYPKSVNVNETSGFSSSGTAYIKNSDGSLDSFYYTGKNTNALTGVTGLSNSHSIGDYVVQEAEGDLTIYDYNYLLPKLKDRIYKSNKVDDNMLFSESQSDYVAKSFLQEFVKNHSKLQAQVLYAPHLEIGQTVEIVDPYNNTNSNYFIDSIEDNNGFYTIVLARYPSS